MKFFKSKEERAACEAEIERKDMRYAERIEALNAQERAERFAEWKRTCTRCEATWYAPVHPEAYSKAIGAAAAFAVFGVVGVIATHSKRAAEENQLAALDRCPQCKSAAFSQEKLPRTEPRSLPDRPSS